MANAQHFFEFGLRGGLADWKARTHYVSPQPGLHAGVEIGYAYTSPQVVGFRAAFTVDRHRTAFGKMNYTDSYQTMDVDNQLMQIDYTIGHLKEMYTFWSVGVPAQITFSWEKIRLAVGPKFVFPLSAEWHEKAANAALSVYYPDYDNRVYDSYPLAASRDFSMLGQGKLSVPKIQYWLASELTYSIPLQTFHSSGSIHYTSYITVGVYFDYCFNDQSFDRNDTESLIMLTDTRDGFPLSRILSPVLTSCYHSAVSNPESSSSNRTPLVSHCALFDVGVKIACTLSPYNPFSRSSRRCNCW